MCQIFCSNRVHQSIPYVEAAELSRGLLPIRVFISDVTAELAGVHRLQKRLDLLLDPYGPAPQPTVDVYQGDSILGEEEAALAGEAGGAERNALIRSGRMSCSQGAFVGGLAIPNPVYRATIQKYARRHADGKHPTTRDIFLAKAAVDRAIGKAGITLYMPGAQPGRRTI